MKNLKDFSSRKDRVNFTWSKILADVKNKQFTNMLNALISAHEKEIIVNRLAALIFIKQGKRYIAHSPAFDLSTSGETVKETQKWNIKFHLKIL